MALGAFANGHQARCDAGVTFDDQQLRRIAERAAGAGVPLARAEPTDVDRAEVELGFTLPTALRQLYLQVGDGGYGPGCDVPIEGYPAGRLYPLVRLLEVHSHHDIVLEDDPYSPWPVGVLQFADLGGFTSVAVDCRGPAQPVLEYDSDVDAVEPRRAWTLVADSVEDWFADWADRRQPRPRERWTDGLNRD